MFLLKEPDILSAVGGSFLVKDTYLLMVLAVFVGSIVNLVAGGVKVGFVISLLLILCICGIFRMFLAGLTATFWEVSFASTILASESTDAGITILGLIAGAAVSHNFSLLPVPRGRVLV